MTMTAREIMRLVALASGKRQGTATRALQMVKRRQAKGTTERDLQEAGRGMNQRRCEHGI